LTPRELSGTAPAQHYDALEGKIRVPISTPIPVPGGGVSVKLRE